MNKSETERLYTLGFSFIPSIGPKKFEMMELFFDSLEHAWFANKKTLLLSGIGERAANSIIENRQDISPKKELNLLKKKKIFFITKNDTYFPVLLKEIHSPPFLLFYTGNVEILNKKIIALVGPRLPSHYGKSVAIKFADELSNAGIIIASGMAQGIDSIAHRVCYENNRPTIAVLGCGIENAKQKISDKKQIASIISNEGIVLSEYPPLTKSAKYTFPARNRIVSGLSLGTIVAEAGERSGTLITARLSLEQNRELFVIPGNIFSKQSIGTNQLLKKGAMPTTCIEDIFTSLNFVYNSKKENPSDCKSFTDKNEELIYKTLSLEPIHIDVLARKTNLAHSELLSKLSILELNSLVQNIGGGMFIKK